jgi:hypothetical protein
LREQCSRPRELVFDTLTSGLRLGPQLEILGPVVETVAIDMVHVLVREQESSELLLHDETVLVDIAVRRGVDVLREIDAAIPVFYPRAQAWT